MMNMTRICPDSEPEIFDLHADLNCPLIYHEGKDFRHHETVVKNVFKSRKHLRKRGKISSLFAISRMRKHFQFPCLLFGCVSS